MNKQERVQEVYNYLVFTHAVENQRGFANALETLHGNLFGSQQGLAIGIDDSWGEAAEKQW